MSVLSGPDSLRIGGNLLVAARLGLAAQVLQSQQRTLDGRERFLTTGLSGRIVEASGRLRKLSQFGATQVCLEVVRHSGRIVPPKREDCAVS